MCLSFWQLYWGKGSLIPPRICNPMSVNWAIVMEGSPHPSKTGPWANPSLETSLPAAGSPGLKCTWGLSGCLLWCNFILELWGQLVLWQFTSLPFPVTMENRACVIIDPYQWASCTDPDIFLSGSHTTFLPLHYPHPPLQVQSKPTYNLYLPSEYYIRIPALLGSWLSCYDAPVERLKTRIHLE